MLEIIGIDHTITLKKTLVNLMSQQAMILLNNHHYKVSQLIDYRLDMFVTSKQNFVNVMIQHMIEQICTINNTKSSLLEVLLKEPSAIFAKLLGQQTLTIAHIVISMNSNRNRHVSKKQEKGTSH